MISVPQAFQRHGDVSPTAAYNCQSLAARAEHFHKIAQEDSKWFQSPIEPERNLCFCESPRPAQDSKNKSMEPQQIVQTIALAWHKKLHENLTDPANACLHKKESVESSLPLFTGWYR